VKSSNLGNWRRTRRNVLAAGGLMAGAALSQLGIGKANAGGPGGLGGVLEGLVVVPEGLVVVPEDTRVSCGELG
jgi:hypothetical protein